MKNKPILEGQISIKAALKSNNRDVYKIYIKKNKRYKDTSYLEKLAKKQGVKVERVKGSFIKELTSGNTHGGVIAEVGDRKYVSLEDLIKGKDNPFIVMMDGIEDPYNFGFAVRSLYAAGADGIVVRPRNWTTAAGIVARSSAGATELIKMAVAETTTEAAEFFKSKGLKIACTANKNSTSLYETDLTVPLFLVIGGAKRGVTRSFIDKADMLIQIPYDRNYGASLPTTSATSVLAFEALRQRKYK